MGRSIGFFGCIILWCSSACLSPTRPYDENYKVEVSDEAYSEYYRQFQGRFLLWEEAWGVQHVEIPGVLGVQTQYNFYEFRGSEDSTCYFRRPASIYIGHDKWSSGCVPHEIGHAVLYTIGHPCWREFEHEEEKEKCLNRF
jgi:hypothetical protein